MRGYTRNVSWTRHVSVLVLVLLAGLPVASTACALFCQPHAGGVASAHHGSGAACAQAPGAADDEQMLGVTAHDCRSHDGRTGQAAPAIDRVSGVSPAPIAIATERTPAGAFGAPRPRRDRLASRAGSPPDTAPLVLRV